MKFIMNEADMTPIHDTFMVLTVKTKNYVAITMKKSSRDFERE